MKKIAIITWFRYKNYGSILQAYALGTYLKDCGYDVSYIDYIPNKQFPKPLINRIISDEFHSKIKEIIFDRTKPINMDLFNRGKNFDNFIQRYFKVTEQCSTNSELESLAKGYDAIICGSDQIWSPIVYDEKYFLTFAKNINVKKISYAPSFGMPNIKDRAVYQQMSDAIKQLDSISVREDSGVDIIYDLTGRKAEVVVDPTLLLSKQEWEKIAKPHNNKIEKPYILLYFLGNNSFYGKYIEWIKRNGFEAVLIPVHNHDYDKKCTIAENIGPEQFIELIRNSVGVCTDSFHATVFSILFNKPFLTLARFKDNNSISQNERLYSLLDLIGQRERFVYSYSDKKAHLLQIKFTTLSGLETRIMKSYDFLNSALEKDIPHTVRKVKNPTIDCSGCGVCAKICPTESIKIEKNRYGFYISKIDISTCINCKLCERICGFNSEISSISKASIYAVRSKNRDILMNSSSGGFATMLSSAYLKKGYQIIGCKYDYSINEAKHAVVKSDENIKDFSGSKYIQSHIDDVLCEIEVEKKYVFIGTPCQVASLNNYLVKKGIRDRFILVDLICHGVPSYNLWHKYVSLIRKKFLCGENIKKISFRKKTNEYTNNNMNMEFVSENKSYICKQQKDLFFKFFCLGNVYARSCYNCNFRTNSSADIRIGDYWGEKYKTIPGTSMILILTEKGNEVFQEVFDELEIEQGFLDDYKKYQQTLNINPPDYYEDIMKALQESDIDFVYKKFVKKFYVLDPIKNVIKFLLKK